MMKLRLLISILLLSLILPSCNPFKTAAGKARGSPAKTEGDLLSSRACLADTRCAYLSRGASGQDSLRHSPGLPKTITTRGI